VQPDANASGTMSPGSGALLYVSDANNGLVRMYDYPQLTLAGTLQIGNPEGLCVDNRSRTIWVVSTVYSQIVEFTHGGTRPIKILKDGVEYPDACAVDTVTGDLAVANVNNQGSDPGSVSIYRKSEGKAHLYSDSKIYFMSFLAYDGKGNLFVDGSGPNYPTFRLAELPRGASTFKELRLTGPQTKNPGGLVYDAGVIAIGDRKRSVIFQTSHGRVTGRTPLGNACYISQFVIDGRRAIVANTCGSINNPTGNILIYDYPRGGSPVKQLTGFAVAFGVAISR
jgi:hypothetical protein